MRAVVMTAPGGPDVLRLADLPEPELTSDHDVRVRLPAAGINPVDCKIRASGLIRGTPPAVLGWDGTGTVEAAPQSPGSGPVTRSACAMAASAPRRVPVRRSR
ncbi:MAG TPA: hypothetical protein VMA72_25050 [Streptosporangiaceae bacterium]|nr:hypothetical protein [Streptosporangiaceae bacterium]